MVQMIPPVYSGDTNRAEKKVFSALEGVTDKPEWIAFHSLKLAHNKFALEGENDFTVFVPGKGIIVIEVKNAKSVEYKNGLWHLEGVPKAAKNPFIQLDRSRRNIHGYLNALENISDIPVARLMWFPSIGRAALNVAPGDMQFFEWEMAWADDLAKPGKSLTKVLDDFMRDFGSVEDARLEPANFTVERARNLADHLVGSFSASQTPEDRRRERAKTRERLLAEQTAILDLIDTNPHIYFDGDAGTGKSFMLTQAAKRLGRHGKKTLVTCWNIMMAEELATYANVANVTIADINRVMLDVCGLRDNPEDADTAWYIDTLPSRAIARLEADPALRVYEALCIDEFQDIATYDKVLQFVFTMLGSGLKRESNIVLAGDHKQQIMGDASQARDPFSVAQTLIADMVHVRLKTNCRTAAGLGKAISRALSSPFDVERYRVKGEDGEGLESRLVTDRNQATALRKVLEELLTEFKPSEIRVLSPFGANHSVAGELFKRTSASKDERWLKTHLKHASNTSGESKIRWRSIAKFKGLESEAVVITDVNQAAADFAVSTGKTLNDLLYVGMTRARTRCILIGSLAPKI